MKYSLNIDDGFVGAIVEETGAMPDKRWEVTFEGVEQSVILVFGEPPLLIELGDGSLWARGHIKMQPKFVVGYVKATVEKIHWLTVNNKNGENVTD